MASTAAGMVVQRARTTDIMDMEGGMGGHSPPGHVGSVGGGGGGSGFGASGMLGGSAVYVEDNVLMRQLAVGGAVASVVGGLLGLIVLGWEGLYILLVMIVCAGGFLFALHLTESILATDKGTPGMRQVADAIKEGAEGYLSTQYSAIFKIAIVTGVVIFGLYMARPESGVPIGRFSLALLTAFSFLTGAACSALAGYVGVWISVRTNLRVAGAAGRRNHSDSLLLAFRGGAVASVLSAALCISGLSWLFVLFFMGFGGEGGMGATEIPLLLVGYGFGASFVALFMQLGGGIYTKAADVGADLVGKVERGIPEDDPRNPAVIADLVGDNVGDCAGSMADVFESIAAEVIGTMMLGAVMAREGGLSNAHGFTFFALVIHSFDLVVSSIGIVLVRGDGNSSPIASLKRGYVITSGVALVGYVFFTYMLLNAPEAPGAWMHFAGCGVIGIVMANLLVLSTQYYTDYAYGPVREIAQASTTGHGTNIIAGLAVGLESTAMPAVIICLALVGSYRLGDTSGIASEQAGLFGCACSVMGMLCTAVYVLSMNNFGPIADNAGGIVEMSDQPEEVRAITDRLDAVGNVTKAATKGYAVGGSALATFVLFRAYMDEIASFTGEPFTVINVAKVEVLVAALMGIMMVFLFSSWAIKAVGVTAQSVIREVRRQLADDPGIMTYSSRPEYGKCVSIVTEAALGQMIKPALLALLMPIAIPVFFRLVSGDDDPRRLAAEALGAFLICSAMAGLLLATAFDNGGGAWDNAKKLIESAAGSAYGGKNSEAHAASVTGDTVGDPLKDTAGPALHVLLTTATTTGMLIAPLILL